LLANVVAFIYSWEVLIPLKLAEKFCEANKSPIAKRDVATTTSSRVKPELVKLSLARLVNLRTSR
jgi:hypothetical protein